MPLALDPPHVARRVSVQRSHFTIHGRDRNALDKLAKEADSRLQKIIIGRDAVKSMIDDLATLGVTETTVFPDLEGLSRDLMRSWA